MALNATLFKAQLDISDIRRHYYHSHNFTVARHPSETDERMMIRILAFCLFADEQLAFTKGLSTDSEPDLWQKSLSGDIELWLEVGLPSEKRLRKARGIAKEVVVLSYGGRGSSKWWSDNGDTISKWANVSVFEIDTMASSQLAALANKSMQLQCTIEDNGMWISSAEENFQLDIQTLCRSETLTTS